MRKIKEILYLKWVQQRRHRHIGRALDVSIGVVRNRGDREHRFADREHRPAAPIVNRDSRIVNKQSRIVNSDSRIMNTESRIVNTLAANRV
jgi:hypothetical protein